MSLPSPGPARGPPPPGSARSEVDKPFRTRVLEGSRVFLGYLARPPAVFYQSWFPPVTPGGIFVDMFSLSKM